MDRILLIDGNSVLFRAYYASNYSQRMVTTFNVETNAVFTFTTMIFKAIEILKPTHLLVAFDSGVKGIRSQWYPSYKGTRKELDESLISQFPIARELLDAANIQHYQEDGIEADDIIGVLSKRYPNDQILILTSDKDLLQLIQTNVTVYLMKQGLTELLRVDEEQLSFMYGLKPKQIIDLKSLMGDNSDNIPGVKGVGEKTAIKLLTDFLTLDGVYDNLNTIKGSLFDKLVNDKESAYLSYKLATILTELPFVIAKDEMLYQRNDEKLYHFFVKYEMKSLINKLDIAEKKVRVDYRLLTNITSKIEETTWFIVLDFDEIRKTLHGVALASKDEVCYYVTNSTDDLLGLIFNKKTKYVYNYKNLCHIFQFKEDQQQIDDLMICSFLVDSQLSTLDKLLAKHQYNLGQNHTSLYGTLNNPQISDLERRANYYTSLAKVLFDLANDYRQQLIQEDMLSLYQTIERPLAYVLYEMEMEGVCVDLEKLKEIAANTQLKLDDLVEKINKLVDTKFNLNSPKQLAEILFDVIGLKTNKKRSTSQEELEKLYDAHPIIPLVLKYRKYQKIQSTYAEGLQKYVYKDHKIHTNYQQCLAQTGRLSSIEPNLQNIGVRNEEGKEIRQAFVPKFDYLLSADYSQIELRILAHLANDENMINYFKNDYDIHTATAMAIYHFSENELTDQMRRNAKAVNFGIVYGISDFGLANQLKISRKQAQIFIDDYLNAFPKISIYMRDIVDSCLETGYVETICHRKRRIPEIKDKNYAIREFGKRAAMNAPIQGSAADLLKIAMINLAQEIKKRNLQSKMIISVHDELLFDVKASELDEVISLVKEVMVNALTLLVPLKVDIAYGENWYGAK